MSPKPNCGSCGLLAGRVTLLFPKASILENRPELCVVQNEASIAAGVRFRIISPKEALLPPTEGQIVAAVHNLQAVASALSWQV